MSAPAAVSDAVVGHVRVMRGWLRFFAVVALLLLLSLVERTGPAVLDALGALALSRPVYLLFIVTGLTLGTWAYLLWRQANAATRFLAAPSEELFIAVASEMRRFWRVGSPLAVVLVGTALVTFIHHAVSGR